MSDRMLLATRKGLLQFERDNGGWRIARTDFPGVAVTAALPTRATARSMRCSSTATSAPNCTAPTTTAQSGTNCRRRPLPADAAGSPTLFQVWTLEAGGAGEPGRLWAGALPAGLFVSADRGEHWNQVSALWNVPEREKWFGGGYDDAGIHTVSPDPRDASRVFVAISCGGVWDSHDAGASWTLRGDGLVAAYMPPELAGQQETAGPASRGALRCCARRDVDAASLRHLPLDRCRRHLDPAQAAGGRFRLCGRRASERPADRLVRARHQGRDCACRATARSP